MAKIGDEVWTVIIVDYHTGATAIPTVVVDYAGVDQESAFAYAKSVLENFFYMEGYYSDFPASSAAVNAFVDGSSTNFDVDELNWQNEEKPSNYERRIGRENKVLIKMMHKDRGEIQYDCFNAGHVLKQSLIIQKVFIEK